MRGSQHSKGKWAGKPGIIPAHAGLTGDDIEIRIRDRDHPRACGAHTGKPMLNFNLSGSSPRMRGSRRSHFLAR